MHTPEASRRLAAPAARGFRLEQGSNELKIVRAMYVATTAKQLRTAAIAERSGVPLAQTKRILTALRAAGIITTPGRAWVIYDHGAVVLALDLEDAETALQQADDAVAMATTPETIAQAEDMRRQAQAALARAVSAMDAAQPRCKYCHDVLNVDLHGPTDAHPRCEEVEAQETLSDEEAEAFAARLAAMELPEDADSNDALESLDMDHAADGRPEAA